MRNKPLKIVFMGTPEFAVPSLRELLNAGFNIVAVVTAPDKPQGRGKQIGTSPVKDFAVSKSLPVLQPVNLKDPDFQQELRSCQADLQIIVAFRMLPEAVWSMPPLGSFNLHASLLPQYRGAAPINWAIMNGEAETGITTFMLRHEIDTGQILFQEKEAIRNDDTAGSLYERLMIKGAHLVVKTARAIQEGTYTLHPQKGEEKFAPKLFRETCRIDWDRPAQEINNFVRGLSPYPAAWTPLNGKTLKIFRTEVLEKAAKGTPGTFVTDGREYFNFQTRDQQLSVVDLQLEGKKRMNIAEFLRGYKPE